MAGKEKIDLSLLSIIPLTHKKLLKGAFPDEDKDFSHLINFFKTVCVLDQRDRKSRTYLAIYKDQVVGYLTISTGFLEGELSGVKSSSTFNYQVLVLGKLYIVPNYRGSGIGQKLLRFVVDIAHDFDNMTGCLGIQVDSNIDKNTIAFYKNFGFEEFDEQDEEEQTVKMFFLLPHKTIDP